MNLGLQAVVLHDCVPSALQRVLENDRFKFVESHPDPTSRVSFNQSVYDVRYVLFSEYLSRIDASKHYDHVLITDIGDVTFNKDPFAAMRARPDIEIFIGSDRFTFKNNIFTRETL